MISCLRKKEGISVTRVWEELKGKFMVDLIAPVLGTYYYNIIHANLTNLFFSFFFIRNPITSFSFYFNQFQNSSICMTFWKV